MLLALFAFSLFVTMSYACTSDGRLCVSTPECCTRPCFIAVCNRRSDNRTKTCHYIPNPCLIRGYVCDAITGVCTVDLSVPTKNSTVKDADMTTTHSPQPQPQPQNGWFIALIVLVCIAIVAIACVGYMVYKSKNGTKRRPPLYRKNTNQV